MNSQPTTIQPGHVERLITEACYRKWEDDEIVSLAKKALADTVPVALAGTTMSAYRVAASTIAPARPGGPLPTASLWTSSEVYQASDVAFAMGAAGHSADWDDYMHPMHGHCSAVLLATLWPLSEDLDNSGRQLIDAFLVGYHINWLVSQALFHAHYRVGWHATSTIGVVGAAAAAGHLLGLQPEQMKHALALSASLACGIRANFGTMSKAIHGGAAARHGIEAALLARAGVTAGDEWLLGLSGMHLTLGGQDSVDVARSRVLEAFESEQHGIETGWGLIQKLYSSCGGIHGAIDATLEALSGVAASPDEIEKIDVFVDPHVINIMRKQRPVDEESARYSPTWVIAATATDRELTPQQVSLAALERHEIHQLRERVEIIEEKAASEDGTFAGRVVIQLQGRTLEARQQYPSGHPLHPISEGDLRSKAEAALRAAGVSEGAEDLLRDISTLDRVRIRELGTKLRAALGQ